MKRNPVTFATYSYYLSFVSSGVLFLTLVFGMIPGLSKLTNIMWVALFSGAVGTFLALAARSDLKGKDLKDDLKRKLRVATRVNVAALFVMVVISITAIVFAIIRSTA